MPGHHRSPAGLRGFHPGAYGQAGASIETEQIGIGSGDLDMLGDVIVELVRLAGLTD